MAVYCTMDICLSKCILLLVVAASSFRMMFKCKSWVIYLVSDMAASWQTNKCRHWCCVPVSAKLDRVTINRLGLELRSTWWGFSTVVICCCVIEAEDDNKKILVGSHEKSTVKFKSKWTRLQPTCLIYSSWILLHMSAACTNFTASSDLNLADLTLCGCSPGYTEVIDRQNLTIV
jgi:hypothetical protein